MSTQYIIQPVAYLFETGKDGVLVPSRGTRESCFNAIRIARKLQNEGHDVTILLSVNADPKLPGSQPGGKAMQRFIESRMPEIKCRYHQTTSHDTKGEMRAAAEHIRELNSNDVVLIDVIKWWHAPRMLQCREMIFQRLHVCCKRKVSVHWLTLTTMELLHEIGGIAFNLLGPIVDGFKPSVR